MRIAPAGNGARIRLNLAESHVLEQLLVELQAELAPGALDASDPVYRRLYPVGYTDDENAAQDFRALTEDTLRTERSERVDACAAEVRAGRSVLRTEIMLDAEGAQRWLRVTNDLRLIFGTRLGITDDADTDDAAFAADLDASPDRGVDGNRAGAHSQVHIRARYLWLTAFQDTLVTALMG